MILLNVAQRAIQQAGIIVPQGYGQPALKLDPGAILALGKFSMSIQIRPKAVRTLSKKHTGLLQLTSQLGEKQVWVLDDVGKEPVLYVGTQISLQQTGILTILPRQRPLMVIRTEHTWNFDSITPSEYIIKADSVLKLDDHKWGFDPISDRLFTCVLPAPTID